MLSPSLEEFSFSLKLNFECTKNIAKYEALLLGLRIAWKYGVKDIVAKGDSDLVVKQVRKLYATKNQCMKQYKHVVWDLIEMFDSFKILYHDKGLNATADKLAVLGSKFGNCTVSPYCEYNIKVLTRPPVPDNVKHWKVFNDDAQVLRFLQNQGEFANQNIDWELMVCMAEGRETFFEKDIIQLKTNAIPRSLVTLESNFNNVDCIINRNIPTSRDVEEHNLGTNGKPRNILLGINLSKEEKQSYAQLLKKYQDCLAWFYSELKAYREELFQHEISLEAKTKPFR
ncbi:hypothetical protein KI387_014837 [Taxus chinensis]|uniref:RNase H type-1 domain-containing protein n=1 Tax=Taxus chinensis TaxID=29808 RepID=A0AA38CV90_TAXCH|nr:hypothetical protein KI387_014837 [Taxus chinensis]